MAFTDEDLKRLKDKKKIADDAMIENRSTGMWYWNEYVGELTEHIPALLARLECAERALNLLEFDPDATKDQIFEALKAWLICCGAEASGKGLRGTK